MSPFRLLFCLLVALCLFSCRVSARNPIDAYERELDTDPDLVGALDHVFRNFDTNKDGVIDAQERTTLVDSGALNEAESYTMQAFDLDNSKSLSREEFHLSPALYDTLESNDALHSKFLKAFINGVDDVDTLNEVKGLFRSTLLGASRKFVVRSNYRNSTASHAVPHASPSKSVVSDEMRFAQVHTHSRSSEPGPFDDELPFEQAMDAFDESMGQTRNKHNNKHSKALSNDPSRFAQAGQKGFLGGVVSAVGNGLKKVGGAVVGAVKTVGKVALGAAGALAAGAAGAMAGGGPPPEPRDETEFPKATPADPTDPEDRPEAVFGVPSFQDEKCCMCQFFLQLLQHRLYEKLQGDGIGIPAAAGFGTEIMPSKMNEVNSQVMTMTGGRGLLRILLEDLLMEKCSPTSMPEIFYVYCDEMWGNAEKLRDSIFYQFNPDTACLEATICDRHMSYVSIDTAVHQPIMSKRYNSGRGKCAMTGGEWQRKGGIYGGLLGGAMCMFLKTTMK